jgi:hypothetical protein
VPTQLPLTSVALSWPYDHRSSMSAWVLTLRPVIAKGGALVERTSGIPDELGLDRPSAARVYDYYLGGAHNFAVDREMAEHAIALWPELPAIIQANRAFLRRAVQFLVGQGIRQFLDLGSGIPTVGNVHEIAQAAAGDARVVYVDIDPVAVTDARLMLAGNEQAIAIHADLRRPAHLLADPELRALLDLDQPVAVLVVAVLHFVADSDGPAAIVAAYRHALAAGSYLALSHATQDGQPKQAESHQALYASTATPMTMRSRSEISRLLDGWDLVAPGVVRLPSWRPEPGDNISRVQTGTFAGHAAVARRP